MHTSSVKKIQTPKPKRLFDIIFTAFLLFVTLPLSILFLTAIFIEHLLRGQPLAPLFYVEKRISQGKSFDFIKFNIFKPDIIARLRQQDQFVNTKKLEHGNGLILTGRILQKIYLDELPQLLNILKGDISVVGPRPVNLEVFEKELERGNTTKAVIRAGLTGNYQSHKGEEGMRQYDLDVEYIKFCKNNPAWKIVLLDIKIIFRTIRILLRAEGI